MQIRSDTAFAGDAESDVLFDAGVRRNDADRHQRTARGLLRADSRRKFGEELLGAVRIDEADHGTLVASS